MIEFWPLNASTNPVAQTPSAPDSPGFFQYLLDLVLTGEGGGQGETTGKDRNALLWSQGDLLGSLSFAPSPESELQAPFTFPSGADPAAGAAYPPGAKEGVNPVSVLPISSESKRQPAGGTFSLVLAIPYPGGQAAFSLSEGNEQRLFPPQETPSPFPAQDVLVKRGKEGDTAPPLKGETDPSLESFGPGAKIPSPPSGGSHLAGPGDSTRSGAAPRQTLIASSSPVILAAKGDGWAAADPIGTEAEIPPKENPSPRPAVNPVTQPGLSDRGSNLPIEPGEARGAVNGPNPGRTQGETTVPPAPDAVKNPPGGPSYPRAASDPGDRYFPSLPDDSPLKPGIKPPAAQPAIFQKDVAGGFDRPFGDPGERIEGDQDLDFSKTANLLPGKGEKGYEPVSLKSAAIPNPKESLLAKSDRVDFSHQVFRAMILPSRNGTEKIRLRLDPPELGHLYLEVTRENESVKATFWTENPVNRGLLEANRGDLRRALEEHGFRLERFDVFLQSEAEHSPERREFLFFGERQKQKDSENETASHPDGSPDTSYAEAAAVPGAHSRVDKFI